MLHTNTHSPHLPNFIPANQPYVKMHLSTKPFPHCFSVHSIFYIGRKCWRCPCFRQVRNGSLMEYGKQTVGRCGYPLQAHFVREMIWVFVTVLLSFWVFLCPCLTLLGPFIASAPHLDTSVEYRAFHPRNCLQYVCLGLLVALSTV